MKNEHKIALVTGATSGLGYETAAQLAANGAQRVMITGRTSEKIADAKRDLVDKGVKLDLLILNAGIVSPPKLTMSEDGFERTISSSLIGHHVLTLRLFERELLREDASIVIAGSEAATGFVPGFSPVDIRSMANEHFEGHLRKAVRAQMRMETPARYKPGNVYATAKMFVAHWARELSRRLPETMAVMAVMAVYPGSAPDTKAIRNANFFMRYLLVPMFKLLPGMSHSVADGAKRYLNSAERGQEVNGEFFASAPKKFTGPLHVVDLPHIKDSLLSKATWETTTELTSVALQKSA